MARATGPFVVFYFEGSHMLPDEEETLVVQAQRGDRVAFEELVRRTARMLFARLYLDTGDVQEAEDLLQETLFIAYRGLHRLAEPTKVRAWLLRIAQNVAIDAARKSRRLKRTADVDQEQQRLRLLVSPRPDEEAEQGELRQQVLAVLRSLPEEYRLPLTLRYLTGADHETIQLQLGLTNGALRGLLHRGLKLLRAEMHKLLGEDFACPKAKRGQGTS